MNASNVTWFTYPSDYGYVVHARILDPVSFNQAGIERHFSNEELTMTRRNCWIDLERMQRRLMEFVA